MFERYSYITTPHSYRRKALIWLMHGFDYLYIYIYIVRRLRRVTAAPFFCLGRLLAEMFPSSFRMFLTSGAEG